MKDFIEKLISRLEDEKKIANNTFMNYEMNVDLGMVYGLERAIEIVNQLVEEYKPTIDVAELVEKFGEENAQSNDGWIPCIERYPETNEYILLSFANFSVPMVGRYEEAQDVDASADHLMNEVGQFKTE